MAWQIGRVVRHSCESGDLRILAIEARICGEVLDSRFRGNDGVGARNVWLWWEWWVGLEWRIGRVVRHSRESGNLRILSIEARICREVLDSRFRGNDGVGARNVWLWQGNGGLARDGELGALYVIPANAGSHGCLP